MTDTPSPPASSGKFTPYQWKLFIFLSIATFFEGYDFIALSQILPKLREDMGLSKADGAMMYGIINAGTVVAYLLVRKADEWGRRRVLTITILGYTLFTAVSGFAQDPYVFTAAQFLARMFLLGEYVIAMVYAAEEFPPDKRGLVIGLMQAMTSFGGIVCAGLAPQLLKIEFGWTAHDGWRMVYFAGVAPLLLIAFARRSLRESSRFVADVGASRKARPFTYIWGTPYRKRMLQMALIWGLTYACTNTTIAFWKEFAKADRGLTEEQVGSAITLAALVSMPMIFYAGKLLDQIGRRRAAVVIFGLGTAGCYLCYVLSGYWPLTIALIFGIFGVSATMSVLNAYGTELFPTNVRADAFAWANNLLGRLAYVGSPLLISAVVDDLGWSLSVSLTAIGPAIALVLILLWLPETNAKDLDETAAIAEEDPAA